MYWNLDSSKLVSRKCFPNIFQKLLGLVDLVEKVKRNLKYNLPEYQNLAMSGLKLVSRKNCQIDVENRGKNYLLKTGILLILKPVFGIELNTGFPVFGIGIGFPTIQYELFLVNWSLTVEIAIFFEFPCKNTSELFSRKSCVEI